MALSRPLTGIESCFLESMELVQLAVEVDPKDVKDIIHKFVNKVAGLRIHQNGNNMVMSDKIYPIQRIPDTIKTAQEAADWASDQHIDFKKTFSILSANDRFVVLNSTHAVADGGFVSRLLQSLSEDDNTPFEMKLPCSFDQVFDDMIREYDEHKRTADFNVMSNDILTKYVWPRPPVKNFDVTTKASYITYFDNAEDFQCYNKKTKKCDGLTESQWAAIILAAKALNQKNKIDPRLDQQYNSNVGCSTCVDFRNYIPKNSKFSVSDVYNFFIVANLTAKNYNPHVTLAELQKDLRNDFIKKKQDDKFFDSMYIMHNGFPKSHTIPPYTIVTTSNVGPQYLRPPFKDFWSQQSEPAVNTDFGFCLLSFSKITPNSNQIILRNRYSSHTVSDNDAKILTDSIRFIMKTIPTNTQIQDVLNELKKFQNS